MEPITAILIDDERSCLQNLQGKIVEYCPELRIMAIVEKPAEAIQLISQYKPDVIFLDIEMPYMNGFRMLNELKDYKGEIIFTTAYSNYTIEAIRFSAFDYLMKPVVIEDLQAAVQRLTRRLAIRTKDRLDVLREALTRAHSHDDRIAVPTGDGLELIQIKEMVRIESSANYSRIFLHSGRSLLVTRLLKEFEEMLRPYRFYRVHNIHLINLDYVRKYVRGDGGKVIMDNGDELEVSRRRKDQFLRLING